MLYMANIWTTLNFKLEERRCRTKKGITWQMEVIQRQVMIQLGAMCTMVTDVLEAHVNI